MPHATLFKKYGYQSHHLGIEKARGTILFVPLVNYHLYY